MPGFRVSYLGAIDKRLFSQALSNVEQIAGYRPDAETDIRRLLERDDLDATSVATPCRSDALMAVCGCQAGKDVCR